MEIRFGHLLFRVEDGKLRLIEGNQTIEGASEDIFTAIGVKV